MDNSIFFATVTELQAKLKARQVSAVELARAFALRLEKFGPKYGALALPLTEQAIRKARDVDGDLKRGRVRSALQGIPYGAKDLLSYAGQPTTWGAQPYAGQVFPYNAAVVSKLDRAGAILVGKLAMIELAGGGGYRYARASLTGPCLNPWDRTRWAGGSSSGSGAAVAAGLVPFAIGSETSGSIVAPSAFCGVTGLRPTYGLVSRYGAMALAWTLDKLGPMCRSAEDCGLILEVIAGKDNRDPGTAGKSFYYTPQYTRKLQDLRIGHAPVDFAERASPSAHAAFQQVLKVLRETGVQLIETKMPDLPYRQVMSTIVAAEGSSVFEPLIKSGKVDQLADQKQIAGLKAGLDIPANTYLKAMRIRRLMKERLTRMFTEVDLLLAPSVYGPAPKISEALDPRKAEGSSSKDPGFNALIEAGNLAGFPALCLPCGLAEKAPVGIQLVGLPFSENTLLAVGKAVQSVTNWHREIPPGL